MSTFMENNGTLSHWRTNDGTDIFYPEGEVIVNGEKKQRGGAPACCPNFGTAPTDGPYAGISLRQHGLVRDATVNRGCPGPNNKADLQFAPVREDDGYLGADFIFEEPWQHRARVMAKDYHLERQGIYGLSHHILLKAKVAMPYSIGFHPYFATAGGPFVLRNPGEDWHSEDLEVDKPFFTVRRLHGAFEIDLSHGTIELLVEEGYTDYCIWTDRPDLYICVEPVRVHHERRYLMLDAGEIQNCQCKITYTPKT